MLIIDEAQNLSAEGQATVNRGIVNKAADEVFDPPARAAWRWQRSLALVGLSVAADAGLLATARLVTQVPQAPEIAAVATPTGAATPAAVAASTPGWPLRQPAQPSPRPRRPTLLRDENQAWRELAQAWKLTPREGDPCQALQREQVRCSAS